MAHVIMRCSGLIATGLLAAIVVSVAGSTANAGILVAIDKSRQQMTVEVDGETRWVWPVSTGRSGYDTPSGTYRAFRMEKDHFSKEWDDAPMPNSIFFTQIGHAIHGSYDTRHIGMPASHGCVRLAPENAAKLYELVEQTGVLKTTVVLTGTTPASAPAVARRRQGVDPYGDDATQQQYGSQPQYGSSYERQYGSVYGEPLPLQGSVYSRRQYGAPLPPPDYRQPAYPQPQYQQPQQPRYQGMFPFNMN
jgi:L,D-transpeptidase catalytic domain